MPVWCADRHRLADRFRAQADDPRRYAKQPGAKPGGALGLDCHHGVGLCGSAVRDQSGVGGRRNAAPIPAHLRIPPAALARSCRRCPFLATRLHPYCRGMAKSPDSPSPRKPRDYARPTRSKAHRPDAPKHDPALDDLLNPAIAKGRAGMGSGTGLQPPPRQFVRPPRRPRRRAHRARLDAGRLQGEAAERLCRAGALRRAAGRRHRSGARQGNSALRSTRTRRCRAPASASAARRTRTRSISAAASPALPRQQRCAGKPRCAKAAPNSTRQAWTPHRPPRPEKSEGGLPLEIKSEMRAEGRSADRDQGAGRRRQPARPHAGAARRHRLRQDLHDGEGDRGDAASGAGARAEQDARRAALRRVQELLPRQRGRVFRLVLRLLPAGSLYPAHRHLYREGFVDQRADRPHAPLGDARAARTRRRDHRRLGVVHLRYRLGRDLFGDDLLAEEGRADRAAPAHRRSGRVAIQAHAADFSRGTFRVRGDTIEIFPAHYEDRAWRVSLFGDEIEKIDEFDPLTGRRDRRTEVREDLRQLALRHAAPDAHPGDVRRSRPN